MTRTHPCSWAVLQPRISEPEPLKILDKLGKLHAKKRSGRYWIKEVGENGWGMVWLDNMRREKAPEDWSETSDSGSAKARNI